MKYLLHNLIAHPLHGLLWAVGARRAAAWAHSLWSPEPEPRYFFVSYSWVGSAGDHGHGATVFRTTAREVSNETARAWRRLVAVNLATKQGVRDPQVVLLSWMELESGDGWDVA